MTWKDKFLRLLVAGEIVPFGDKSDKELVGRVLDRIDSDETLQRRLGSLGPADLRVEVERLLEEQRHNR